MPFGPLWSRGRYLNKQGRPPSSKLARASINESHLKTGFCSCRRQKAFRPSGLSHPLPNVPGPGTGAGTGQVSR